MWFIAIYFVLENAGKMFGTLKERGKAASFKKHKIKWQIIYSKWCYIYITS